MLVEWDHTDIVHANKSDSKVRENAGNATNNKWTSTADMEQCDGAFTQSYIRAGDQRMYEQKIELINKHAEMVGGIKSSFALQDDMVESNIFLHIWGSMGPGV